MEPKPEVDVDELTVTVGEKYALIALQTITPHPVNRLTTPVADGLWVSARLPMKLEDHWKDWIGTLRAEALHDADLVIVATMKASAPALVDEDNRTLAARVSLFYQSLLLAGAIRVFDQPVRLTGGNSEGEIDVRELTDLRPPIVPLGVRGDQVTPEMIGRANALRAAIDAIRNAGRFDRVFRIFNVHYATLANPDPQERLHGFCRCLEGFILPDKGATTRQFASRTALFVGPGHADFMQRLYVMRSTIGHLNRLDFDDWPKIEREKRLVVCEAVATIEAISRYCLARFLLTPALWPHFADDAALDAFWRMDAAERQSVWGEPLDLSSARASFNRDMISDAELGL